MKKINAALIVSTLLLSGVSKAEEVSLVAVDKPTALDEGTQRELSDQQIAELLPWAKDSKMFLFDLLENVQSLNTTDRVERLLSGIKNSVIESAPKNSELLMRYALNRAIVINDILDREMDPTAVGTIDAKSRVLIASIQMALKYYDADLATLSKKSASPFATFGIEYFNFLTELNKSIFDASAQYNIQRTSLEWLQWDLYRDLNNTTYAPQIVKINNALKIFPTKKISDSQSLTYIRQMKQVSEQLKVLVKPAETKTKDEVIFGKKVTETEAPVRTSNGRSIYSTYYGKCYALSASGDVMYGSQLPDDDCFSGRYSYSTYYGKCYKVSNAGDTMYSSQVSDNKCFGNKYSYSTYYGKCYKVSNAGDPMYSSQVDDDNCFGKKYSYSSYYGKCYKVSNAGDVMYSSPVDANYCR